MGGENNMLYGNDLAKQRRFEFVQFCEKFLIAELVEKTSPLDIAKKMSLAIKDGQIPNVRFE